MFEKVLRDKTLAQQTISKQTHLSIGSPGKPRKRSSFLVTISDSEESTSAGVPFVKNPNQTICEYMVMNLLNEQDSPYKASQIFLQFLQCLRKQTQRAKTKFRKKSSMSDYFRQSSDVSNSKAPPYMFQQSLGHPVCILANRMLGVNGQTPPQLWEVNYFLQKRADLTTFLKISLEDTISLIQEEKKEQAQGSHQSSLRNSLRFSNDNTTGEGESRKETLDLPEFQNQKMRVKLHQLISFTEKHLTNESATLLAGNLLHQMQLYNCYISSFQQLLVPIEWPRTASLATALSQNIDSIDYPDNSGTMKARPVRKVTDVFKRNQLENIYSIQEIDMQLFDRCFILLVCLYCQLRKKDLDFKQLMQRADSDHKGYVSMWEFKNAMHKAEVVISEEDVILLSRVCSFLNRSTNLIKDPQIRYDCSLYIDYAKLVEFLNSSKIKSSYKNYHYHLSIFQLAIFKSIQKTVGQKKANLKGLFKLQSLQSYEQFQLEMKKIYRGISFLGIERIFIETVTAAADQRAETFAEAFYHHVSKEGGFEKGIILNELI